MRALKDPNAFLFDHLLTLKPVKFLEGELIHDVSSLSLMWKVFSLKSNTLNPELFVLIDTTQRNLERELFIYFLSGTDWNLGLTFSFSPLLNTPSFPSSSPLWTWRIQISSYYIVSASPQLGKISLIFKNTWMHFSSYKYIMDYFLLVLHHYCHLLG